MGIQRIDRRRFIITGAWTGLAAWVVGCQEQAVPIPTRPPDKPAAPASTKLAEATPAAAATKPAAAAAAAQDTPVPQGGSAPGFVAELPRNQTIVISVSDTINQMTDAEIGNALIPGALRTGWHFAQEPLYFYNPLWTNQISGPPWRPDAKDGEIPYLATGYEYRNNFTELLIKIRPKVAWSDGTPFSANDIVFTLKMLRDNAPKLTFSNDMQVWLKDAVAENDLSVRLTLNRPHPRFFHHYFEWRGDFGFHFVPEHVFKQVEDVTTFPFFDLAKGWPLTTGPWKLVHSSPEQKIWDRRDDWWGAQTGFGPLPRIKRVIILPHFEDPKLTQLLAAGEVDATHNIQDADTEIALARNPKLQTWKLDKSKPYGALEFWTNHIAFNAMKEPWSDPEVRWAVNYALDRKQIVDVGFKGGTQPTVLPLPAYPGMLQYFDVVKDLLDKNPVDTPNPGKTAEIMQRKGYTKDGEGFWSKGGERLEMIFLVFPGFFQNFAPIIVQQMRKAGFDASFKSPTNAGTLEATGDADVWINGYAGSYADPWINLDQHHSRWSRPIGEAAPQPFHWKNDEFDKALEEMGVTPAKDPKFMAIYRRAMEIFFKELPSIPTVQWYTDCPYNTQYWKNWPHADNPYAPNSMWHRGTAGLVLNSLEPA